MEIYVSLFLNFAGEKRVLNSELWHACAGPLVSLPAVGSRVVYFPQGHSEQVSILIFFFPFLSCLLFQQWILKNIVCQFSVLCITLYFLQFRV